MYFNEGYQHALTMLVFDVLYADVSYTGYGSQLIGTALVSSVGARGCNHFPIWRPAVDERHRPHLPQSCGVR